MKTIKIKIPLAVDAEGNYYAWGDNDTGYEFCENMVHNGVRDDIQRTVYCLEFEIPSPGISITPSPGRSVLQGTLEEIRVIDPDPVISGRNLA